jgi:hypothetical protein
LLFQGIDARRVLIEIRASGPIGEVHVASNALSQCTPYIGSLQHLEAPYYFGNPPLHAGGAYGRSAGPVRVFSGTFDSAITRQECELTAGAHRDDFSTLRLGVLTGYRFFTEANGAQFIPGDERLHPVQRYTLRFDASVENPIFEGAGVVQRDPTECELTEDAAAVVVRWRDENRAGMREFGLFVLAGIFAIGASMLIESFKAAPGMTGRRKE